MITFLNVKEGTKHLKSLSPNKLASHSRFQEIQIRLALAPVHLA